MIEFKEYNEIIQQWLQGVLDSYRKDAELTLKYCNKLIEYGMHNNDVKILGYAYYHLSGTYYCLNDGDKFLTRHIRHWNILSCQSSGNT